jgi:hypothetical protein
VRRYRSEGETGLLDPSSAPHAVHNATPSDRVGVNRRQIRWECVHVCVEDATRLACVEALPDEKATTAIGFLRQALAFYRSHGIEVEFR